MIEHPSQSSWKLIITARLKIQKLIYSLTKEEYISLVSLKNDRKHKFFYNTIITYCIKDMTKNCYLDLSSSRELHLKKTEEREIIND